MSFIKISNELIHFFNYFSLQKKSVLIGVSGGCDSVALLRIICNLKIPLGINKIGVAHVNHCLRGNESDEDDLFVRSLAKSLDCEFFTKRLEHFSPLMSGIEENARQERYSFFHKIKNEFSYDLIATAHTADDQAETVLFRLIRGTGIRGLCAIHPIRNDGVIRPLLTVQKKDILCWLHENNIAYRTDSSNDDLKFKRNYIRHKILPVITENDPDAINRIACIANDANRAWWVLENEIHVWNREYLKKDDNESIRIDKKGLKNQNIAFEAVRLLLESLDVGSVSIHTKQFIDSGERSNGEFLLSDIWAYYPLHEAILIRKRKCLPEKKITKKALICPGITRIDEINRLVTVSSEENREKIITSDHYLACLDAEKCGNYLYLRNICKSDLFTPLGRSGIVNVFEFLKKQGCNKAEREKVLLVINNDNKIVWVVGIRIDDNFRVTEKTRNIIKISFQPLCDIV
jgi:tRNA(Ile)-lysidine synthase